MMTDSVCGRSCVSFCCYIYKSICLGCLGVYLAMCILSIDNILRNLGVGEMLYQNAEKDSLNLVEIIYLFIDLLYKAVK